MRRDSQSYPSCYSKESTYTSESPIRLPLVRDLHLQPKLAQWTKQTVVAQTGRSSGWEIYVRMDCLSKLSWNIQAKPMPAWSCTICSYRLSIQVLFGAYHGSAQAVSMNPFMWCSIDKSKLLSLNLVENGNSSSSNKIQILVRKIEVRVVDSYRRLSLSC